MFNIFKKKKAINIDVDISSENQLIKKEQEEFDKKMRQTELWEKNNEKYFKYTKESLEITEEIWNNNLYSQAINQDNVFNEYASKYINLCNRLLQLLPYNIEHDKNDAKIRNEEYRIRSSGQHITNMIRLLEKQEKYNEIINVCRYLLSLGITEDGTKKGVKGRIEKAVSNFNSKFNTNYTYQIDNDLIIDLETGEIME